MNKDEMASHEGECWRILKFSFQNFMLFQVRIMNYAVQSLMYEFVINENMK
jgi:hypothetical protein